MLKSINAVATGLALACAGPASAQIVGRPDYGPVAMPDRFIGDSALPGPSIRRELRDIDRRVERGREAGLLTRREARAFRREARQVAALANRYGHDGYSAAEARELRIRAGVLRDQVQRGSRQTRRTGRS